MCQDLIIRLFCSTSSEHHVVMAGKKKFYKLVKDQDGQSKLVMCEKRQQAEVGLIIGCVF